MYPNDWFAQTRQIESCRGTILDQKRRGQMKKEGISGSFVLLTSLKKTPVKTMRVETASCRASGVAGDEKVIHRSRGKQTFQGRKTILIKWNLGWFRYRKKFRKFNKLPKFWVLFYKLLHPPWNKNSPEMRKNPNFMVYFARICILKKIAGCLKFWEFFAFLGTFYAFAGEFLVFDFATFLVSPLSQSKECRFRILWNKSVS